MGKISQKEVLEYCIQHYIPFAISKQPGASENIMIVSKQAEEIDLNEFFKRKSYDGFIIAPFDLSKDKIQFLNRDFGVGDDLDEIKFNEIKLLDNCTVNSVKESFVTDYKLYKEQFERVFGAIKSGLVSKAILSRIKPNDHLSINLAAEFYYKLSTAYPNAYTFMCYTAESGLWTGASPELLFRLKEEEVTTVSLAGTQKWSDGNVDWDNKEKDEQQIVSDFINDTLKKYDVSEVDIIGPESIKAGKISHLKTQYKFSIKSINNSIGSFINDIHPTPAVCGLPKDKSMDLIQQTEKHERSYYAGFVGFVKHQNIDLFVNIRSMKFTNTGADLYLGGGITLGSEAEKEWNETELKAETLQMVIDAVRLNNQS